MKSKRLTELFLIDDMLEDEVGQPDDKRPKPGIFLKQRDQGDARFGIQVRIVIIVER